MKHRVKGKIKKECTSCGVTFEDYSSRINRRITCSKKCLHKVLAIRFSAKPNIICCVCGKPFHKKAYIVKHGKGKTCSWTCRNKSQSLNRRGDKSPLWKGGATPIKERIRSLEKYYIWRSKVYKRDGYKCRHCGTTKSGVFHAHHIVEFSAILSKIKNTFPLFNIEDLVRDYQDLWRVDNGITLCKECHKKEHRRLNALRTSKISH